MPHMRPRLLVGCRTAGLLGEAAHPLLPHPHVQAPHTFLALTLFLSHLVRRLVESTCVMVYPRTARMHAIAYAFGMSYYIVVPLSLMPHSFWEAESHPGEKGGGGGGGGGGVFGQCAGAQLLRCVGGAAGAAA